MLLLVTRLASEFGCENPKSPREHGVLVWGTMRLQVLHARKPISWPSCPATMPEDDSWMGLPFHLAECRERIWANIAQLRCFQQKPEYSRCRLLMTVLDSSIGLPSSDQILGCINTSTNCLI